MRLAQKVAVNASALAAGRMAAAAMGIVSVGFSTRYLGLEDYGALATAIAFAAILNTLTDAGIWNIGAREMAKRPEARQEIVAALIAVGLGLSVAAAGVGVATALLIYGGSGDELVRRAVLMLLITVPLAAPYGAITAFFIARQQPYMGMAASVSGSIVTLLLVVLATTLDWGFTGVVLAYVVAAVAQVAVMALLAVGKLRLWSFPDLALSRQLFVWALPLGGAMVVHSLYWRIDLIILSLLSSDAEVGLYGLAYRVVDALVVIPGFVTISLLPEFARLAEKRERFRQTMEKALSVMQVGAFAVLVLFAAFAREFTQIVGGDDFTGAEGVLQVLMVGVALTYLTSVFAEAFVAFNRQKRLLVLSLVLLPVNVVLNLALIPAAGALGAALAFALTEALHLALLVMLYRGFATIPRPRQTAKVAVAAACMAAVALLKLLPFFAGLSAPVVLAAGGALSLSIYVAVLYRLGAMPPEIHLNLVVPLWSRLRPGRAPS